MEPWQLEETGHCVLPRLVSGIIFPYVSTSNWPRGARRSFRRSLLGNGGQLLAVFVDAQVTTQLEGLNERASLRGFTVTSRPLRLRLRLSLMKGPAMMWRSRRSLGTFLLMIVNPQLTLNNETGRLDQIEAARTAGETVRGSVAGKLGPVFRRASLIWTTVEQLSAVASWQSAAGGCQME